MTDPSQLSTAAQAVLDAFNREARPEPHHQLEAIAAALRAAAMHLPCEEYVICNVSSYGMMIDVYDLLDLATELKNHG